MSSVAAHGPLVRAVIVGASGRMGQALLRAAAGFPRLLITGAIASDHSLALGRDAGEVAGIGRMNLTVASDLPAALGSADVAIDFSHPAATRATLRACREARKPLLLGTTGLGPDAEAELDAASGELALLVAPNTSLGAALLTELTRIAARTLPSSFDIDVLELHHRLKRDAPSGTARALASAAQRARDDASAGPAAADPERRAAAVRAEGEIGVASLRAGAIVGEHTVLFCGAGEELALTHRARDRGVFARGALSAALWLSSRPRGRYEMRDFLGLKTEG